MEQYLISNGVLALLAVTLIWNMALYSAVARLNARLQKEDPLLKSFADFISRCKDGDKLTITITSPPSSPSMDNHSIN